MEGECGETRTCRGGTMKTCWQYTVENKFLVSCLTAVALGVALGLVLKAYVPMSESAQDYLGFPGEMLVRMLQAITVPLIVTSIITSVASLGMKSSRRIALHALAFYTTTTILALILGLVLVLTMKPGKTYGVDKADTDDDDEDEESATINALFDLFRNMIPSNLIQSSFEHYQTQIVETEMNTDEQENVQKVMLLQDVKGTNTIGLVFCSFIFGIALRTMKEKGKALVEVIAILNAVTKYVLRLILGYLPLGVLFIIARQVVEVDHWETVLKLGKLMGVVILGLLIHALVVLPLLYVVCVRRSPFTVIKGISPALLTAVLVSSSAATQPIMFRCCEDRLNINTQISRFMVPIGNNINKNGSVIYEVVAAIFIAQFNNIYLDLNQLITLIVTSVVSSTGKAGIPSTGAVSIIIILAAVGLPAKDASLLVFVEWLLDHFVTLINVMGNCMAVAIVSEVLKKRQVREMQRTDRSPDKTHHISNPDSDDETLYSTPHNRSPRTSYSEDSSFKSLGSQQKEYLSFSDSDNE